MNFIRQYEANIYQAMMTFGRRGADRLFPTIRITKADEEDMGEEGEQSEGVAAQ